MIRILFKIVRGIWRWFWRLVHLSLILCMVGVGFLVFQGYESSGHRIDQAVQQAATRVRQWIGMPTGVSLGDVHTEIEDGTRWESNRVTIYLSTQDQTFRQAYQEAIANWNATGAFEFVLVDREQDAQVVATDMNDGSVSAAGVTESESNVLTKRLVRATVKLNHYYLSNPRFGYDMERIRNTAEHELGHAIGLAHNEGQSVMQSAGSYLSIQPEDVVAVRKLYGLDQAATS